MNKKGESVGIILVILLVIIAMMLCVGGIVYLNSAHYEQVSTNNNDNIQQDTPVTYKQVCYDNPFIVVNSHKDIVHPDGTVTHSVYAPGTVLYNNKGVWTEYAKQSCYQERVQ